MEVLAERFHNDVKPDVTIETPEQDFVLDVYAGSSLAEGQSVVVYNRCPADMTTTNNNMVQADHVLHREEKRKKDSLENDGSFVLNLGLMGDLEGFRGLKLKPALLKVLGYNLTAEDTITDGVYHRWTEFRYPSVEQLNTFLDAVSPNEGVRYLSYPGGKFSTVESSEAFSKEGGYVLVAEDLDYQPHEHLALHVLGALGLHGEYVKYAQEFVAAYLRRHKAELALPAVPNQNKEPVRKFLNPSYEVVRSFALALDNLTATLGYKVFSDRSDKNYDQTFAGTLGLIYHLSRGGVKIPSWILDEFEGPDLEKVGHDTVARFERLAQAALELTPQDTSPVLEPQVA